MKLNEMTITFKMEQDRPATASLFPSFIASSNSSLPTPLFPAFDSSSSNTLPAPLFPAYTSHSERNQTENSGIDKDWLRNSSYAPSNTEIIYNNQEEILLSDEPLPKKEKKKNKHSKKHKKGKTERQRILDTNLDTVAECDSIRGYLNKKTFLEETGLSLERAYRIDSKCDTENIHFEHLEQKNIANYKLYPKIPVGLSKEQRKIWPNLSRTKNKDTSIRYFSKKALKLLNSISSVEKIDFKHSPLPEATLKFIPLSQHKNVPTILNYSKEGYDGISQTWKLHSSLNSDKNESKIEESSFDSEFRERTVDFNKKLLETPRDIQLWLDFVDFQDELYLSKSGELYHTESSLIEKKIAILDKALGYNPKSLKLNVYKLNLCRNIWKLDQLIQSWEELIFLYPNNIEVWQEYIIFILTSVTYFTTTKIVKLYGKCLSTLSNISEGIIQTHVAPDDIIPNMLDLFSQMCFILKNCGYVEKAIASFQALIELNLLCEKAVELLPIADQISFLEPFWDSGALRFGEEGAIGWAATVAEGNVKFNKIVTQSDLSSIEDDILEYKLPQWETWMKFEKLREFHHWLPWRPNPEYDQTDDDIDDTERNISFEDISKFLFRVSKEEHKFMLILNFVKFLGFNPHYFGCNMSNLNSTTCIDIQNFDVISKVLKVNLFGELDTPFYSEPKSWTKDRIDFINNIFSQSREKFTQKYKTLLSLLQIKFYQKCSLNGSESIIKHDDAKKFTKSVLKENENRNCLLLWFEFIRLEYLSSKTKAKKTFETLLTSSCNAVCEENMSINELWYFIGLFLDLCLGIQDCSFINTNVFSHDEIISILVCVSCKEKYSRVCNNFTKPTFILRAVSNFKSYLQQELQKLPLGNFEVCSCINPCNYPIFDCLKCFAYLQYFTKGYEAITHIFEDVIEYVEVNLSSIYKKYILEQVICLQADLLNFHIWNSSDSLKLLQSFLQISVTNYSDNPKLLFYLIKLKSASSVISPTRRFFVKILKGTNKHRPNIWIFALASELAIMNSIAGQQKSLTEVSQYQGQPVCQGINWKIRALYERALALPSCSCIPLLWRSYIKFEISNNEIEKAKSIFHRSMQNCGWYKDLVLDGIDYFHDNLKQLVEFMAEKQMRIHTPMEEVELLMKHCLNEEI